MEILYNDTTTTCQSNLHARQNKMEVCVSKACTQQPNLICVDCSKVIHANHSHILPSEQFVKETNMRYKNIKENVLKLESQITSFQNKTQTVKKQYKYSMFIYHCGEIERLKNTLLLHLDTMREVMHTSLDKIDMLVTKHITNQIGDAQKQIDTLKPHRIDILALRYGYKASKFQYNLNSIDSFNVLTSFFAPLQNQISTSMVNLTTEVNKLFMAARQEQEEIIKNNTQYVISGLNDGIPKQISMASSERDDLLTQRDQIHQQMLHLSTTTKQECYKIKAFYGFYYLNSNYAQYGELPLWRQGKPRTLNEKMNDTVQRLYQIGYRDSTERDYVWAYFLK